MSRLMVEDSLFPDCPIRNILARISDKWSLLVIYTLHNAGKASMRFKELQRAVPDISQKMLTVTLRTLAERAQSLLPHIDALIGWAKENMEAILQDRRVAVR